MLQLKCTGGLLVASSVRACK